MGSKRALRGVSTALLAFLISLVVLLVFTYVFLSNLSLVSVGARGLKSLSGYANVHRVYQLVAERSVDSVYLINVGPSDIVVESIVVKNTTGGVEVKKPLEVCNSTILQPLKRVKCSALYDYVAVVTVDGALLYPETPTLSGELLKRNTTLIIPVRFNFSSVSDLEERFNVSEELIAKPYTSNKNATGMTGARVLRLPPGQESEFENAEVYTRDQGRKDDSIPFGVLVVGYDPSYVVEKTRNPEASIPPRFSILLASPQYQGNEQIVVNGRAYPLSKFGQGLRIILQNFTGTIQVRRGDNILACSSSTPGVCPGNALPALGTWYYGVEQGLELYLSGNATYIACIGRLDPSKEEYKDIKDTSYFPYLYVGDIDGNGLEEIVFITEDAYYGDVTSVNDYYGNDDFSDWSTKPLVLKLLDIGRALGSPDGSVDGSVYSGLLLYMNIFFHDNSYPDEKQLEDIDRTDWVLRVLLVDESGNEYVVREYRYQEICNYHKTLITDFGRDNYYSKISQSLYISLPSTGKYWVAIAFQDPYKEEYSRVGIQNDADFTVGVELIGVIPFYRPP